MVYGLYKSVTKRYIENVRNGKLVLKGFQTRIKNLNFALWFSVSAVDLDELISHKEPFGAV